MNVQSLWDIPIEIDNNFATLRERLIIGAIRDYCKLKKLDYYELKNENRST